MSAIFLTANAYDIAVLPNYLQSISAGGYRHSEVFAPAFYEISLGMPPMYYDTFQPVEAELLAMEYGVYPFNTTLPHDHAPPYSLMPNCTITNGVAGSNQIVLSGHPSTPPVGSYLQIAGSSKVFQIKEIVNPTTFKLNSILIHSPASGTAVRFGNNVVFHLQLTKSPRWGTIPGNIKPLYSFQDQIIFREVITKNAVGAELAQFHELWAA